MKMRGLLNCEAQLYCYYFNLKNENLYAAHVGLRPTRLQIAKMAKDNNFNDFSQL